MATKQVKDIFGGNKTLATMAAGTVNAARDTAQKAANTTYKYGSTGSGVKELQNKLTAAGYDVGGADGIYGNKTAAAVKQYQKDHGLTVDGVAGKNTLSSLSNVSAKGGTSTSGTLGSPVKANKALEIMAKSAVNAGVTAAGGTPDYTSVVDTKKTTGTEKAKTATGGAKTADPVAPAAEPATVGEPPVAETPATGTGSGFTHPDFVASDIVNQAWDVLNQHQANKPGDYSPVWQDEADAYLNQYQNRDPFSYDFNSDALYQQYKDNYIQQGQMAMMDTMGQAAAMTGGYGNSYAQTAGQQAYNLYLNQLNDVMPELYQMAHDRYTQEGQNMLDMYDLYMNKENYEYSKYQDVLNNWYQEDSRLQSNYDSLYNREWNEYITDREEKYNDYWNNTNMEYQKERDKVADEQWEKTYNKSVKTYTGNPVDDDDDDDDDDDNAGDNYDNGSVSTANIKAMQAALGVDADGMWGEKSQKAAGGLSADEAYKQFTMGKLAGTQRVSDGMIKKFQANIYPESQHDTVMRATYGPYTSYVAYMLEKDTTLTDAEKDYLISYYGITSSDRQYLIDKGLIK